MTEQSELSALLTSVFDRHRSAKELSPSWLATEVLTERDPERETDALIYLAAHLQLRQMARALCRARFDGITEGAEVSDLFPETLQDRYPRAPKEVGAEPVYVLRDYMSLDDVLYNVARLRAEGRAKLKHADALETWGLNRRDEEQSSA